ncbi:MAG: DUF5840 family protein [Oscillatoriaceae cyanobacterium Prado104]|jgi:prenylated cyclic peptide (anacyclamide/piricyclamide family)|nr:DUF5840 family protein [Oscillatoriaceae cyanobacterium Prado104]
MKKNKLQPLATAPIKRTVAGTSKADATSGSINQSVYLSSPWDPFASDDAQ